MLIVNIISLILCVFLITYTAIAYQKFTDAELSDASVSFGKNASISLLVVYSLVALYNLIYFSRSNYQ